MLQVMSCLVKDHDYAFVAAAAVTCVVGSTITMQLLRRTASIANVWQSGWIALTGLACGSVIWTTHFVAMLGFEVRGQPSFDPVLTIASLAIAVVFAVIGLHIAAMRDARLAPEFGGAIIGFGIAAMHFTGMLGYQVPGHIAWDPVTVGLSIFLAIAFGALAMRVAAGRSSTRSMLLAAACLVLAISSTHFTAMAAINFVPDPLVTVATVSISEEFLAVVVVATMVTITGATLYFFEKRSQLDMIESLRHAAEHDPLTGLPNRTFLANRLADVLTASKELGHSVAVVTLDLDRFKEINDVHGHAAGDLVLTTLATRFAGLGPGEFVARIGGDEFVAIKQPISGKSEIDDFAHRLVRLTSEPVHAATATYNVGVSIGVSIYPDDAVNIEDLIGAADLSMYRAKNSASEKICYYDRNIDERRRDRSSLAIELQQAIKCNELELYYQPQHSGSTGKVVGFEALLRWNHRTRGLVGAQEFIPVAEESGLIIDIGNWVLKAACTEASRWKKAYKISVNVAARQLTQSDLPAIVDRALKESGLKPSRLILELTEAGLIEDTDRALAVVRKLKSLGVSIAMDDYGVGYSSLVTFQLFPFDKVKIDRSFIEKVTSDRTSAAIVKATITLARQLKIAVLAEGVECPATFAFLRAAGCTEMQGFLFGRPVPLEDISEIVGRKPGTPKARPLASRDRQSAA